MKNVYSKIISVIKYKYLTSIGSFSCICILSRCICAGI